MHVFSSSSFVPGSFSSSSSSGCLCFLYTLFSLEMIVFYFLLGALLDRILVIYSLLSSLMQLIPKKPRSTFSGFYLGLVFEPPKPPVIGFLAFCFFLPPLVALYYTVSMLDTFSGIIPIFFNRPILALRACFLGTKGLAVCGLFLAAPVSSYWLPIDLANYLNLCSILSSSWALSLFMDALAL